MRWLELELDGWKAGMYICMYVMRLYLNALASARMWRGVTARVVEKGMSRLELGKCITEQEKKNRKIERIQSRVCV